MINHRRSKIEQKNVFLTVVSANHRRRVIIFHKSAVARRIIDWVCRMHVDMAVDYAIRGRMAVPNTKWLRIARIHACDPRHLRRVRPGHLASGAMFVGRRAAGPWQRWQFVSIRWRRCVWSVWDWGRWRWGGLVIVGVDIITQVVRVSVTLPEKLDGRRTKRSKESGRLRASSVQRAMWLIRVATHAITVVVLDVVPVQSAVAPVSRPGP